MPYASRAQQKKFHAMEQRGEIDQATVREFDQASKGKKLPARVHPALKAAGESWQKLHMHKFEKNCGRFGKKCD